jgi:hypothetical protein
MSARSSTGIIALDLAIGSFSPSSITSIIRAMSEQTALEFEREKWRGEYELRKREIEIKERDASRSRWSSPLVLAVLAAATAALGNAAAIWLNGIEQRDLETTKTEQARILEESKAEAARILEVIKTGNNSDKAAVNLKFLVDAGLISDPDRRKNIEKFLVNRATGEGPALPSQVSDQALGTLLLQLQNSIEHAPKLSKEQLEMMMKMMQQQQASPPPPKTPR